MATNPGKIRNALNITYAVCTLALTFISPRFAASIMLSAAITTSESALFHSGGAGDNLRFHFKVGEKNSRSWKILNFFWNQRSLTPTTEVCTHDITSRHWRLLYESICDCRCRSRGVHKINVLFLVTLLCFGTRMLCDSGDSHVTVTNLSKSINRS